MVITCKTKSVLYTVAHWHKCPREIIQEFWASVHFSCFISQIMLKCRFSDFVYDLFTSVSVTKFHSYGRVKKRQKDFTVTDGVDCTWTFLAMAINESWNAGLICEPFNTKLRLACPELQQKVSVDLYKVFTSMIHIRHVACIVEEIFVKSSCADGKISTRRVIMWMYSRCFVVWFLLLLLLSTSVYHSLLLYTCHLFILHWVYFSMVDLICVASCFSCLNSPFCLVLTSA